MPSTSSNIAERFAWTFVAAALGAVPVAAILTGNGGTIAWSAALTAGIAGALALAKNLLLKPPAFAANKALGLVERVLWTAVQAFVASLPATINLTGHDLRALAYSGLMAAIAAVVSLSKNLTTSVQGTLQPVYQPLVPVAAQAPGNANGGNWTVDLRTATGSAAAPSAPRAQARGTRKPAPRKRTGR